MISRTNTHSSVLFVSAGAPAARIELKSIVRSRFDSGRSMASRAGLDGSRSWWKSSSS